jgi:hypothetical protein
MLCERDGSVACLHPDATKLLRILLLRTIRDKRGEGSY